MTAMYLVPPSRSPSQVATDPRTKKIGALSENSLTTSRCSQQPLVEGATVWHLLIGGVVGHIAASDRLGKGIILLPLNCKQL